MLLALRAVCDVISRYFFANCKLVRLLIMRVSWPVTHK